MSSKKVRIHDLAKQYGMPGKDLAAKLRDLGFSKAKSHMSALDEFEVLQVQGILEAHGLIREESGEGQTTSDLGGGLVLRKKKKKKKVEKATAEVAAPEAPEPEPAAPEPEATEPVAEVEPEPAPPPAPAPSPEPEVASVEESDPAPVDLEPEEAPVVLEPLPAPEPEPVEVAEAHEPIPVAEPLAPMPDPEPVTAGAPAEVTPPEPVAAEVEQPVEATAEDAQAVEAAGPKGNVVGFIDPSSFAPREQPRRRAEARRLQSGDDSAPDVRPTFSQDRSKALLRGAAGARGSLTAAQLRERESGRFLRRSRPGGPGRGGRGGPGGRGGGHRGLVTESPLMGSRVTVEAPVTIAKIAEALKLKSNVVLRQALTGGLGVMNINAVLDDDTARLLAEEFQVELDITHQIAAEEALLEDLKLKRSSVEEGNLMLRTPTVAFLGHVDHGKTTLIDKIRATRVAEGEAGGITQHIGAYQVTTQKGHKVTIVDTPGHAAFTAMRARGARSVDLVVLVVAGDDGVKPHTEEALNHARAAGVPVIVAITKKDKSDYDASKTMQQLTALELNPEEWGGQTAMLQVSGMTGEGLEELLERIFLEGELLELKAHPDGPAAGVVLEAEKQTGKGIVAHLLVQDGTLNRGDVILAGEGYGRVRSIADDRGNNLESAVPSTPVEVTGLDALPGVGDAFHVVENLAQAKEVATERERNTRAMAMAAKREPSAALEAILGGQAEKEAINLIVRADVQGSTEVLKHAISELQHEEVEIKLVHIGVGPITESDVDLAKTSDAMLVAFHVGVSGKARTEAERAGLEIRRYTVIYELLDDLRMMMEGALAPEYVEEVIGHVEIRKIFKSSRIGLIAGCFVIDGKIERSSKIRLLRDQQVVHTGALGSLRREKDDAKEVREGFECGIVLRDYRDIREGDIVEAYKVKEVKRTLESAKES